MAYAFAVRCLGPVESLTSQLSLYLCCCLTGVSALLCVAGYTQTPLTTEVLNTYHGYG